MDVLFLYQGQTFVWNAQKALKNRAKHGVRFETACEVFFDRQGTFIDASVSEEERLGLVGFSNAFKLLFVVHLEKEESFIRIISAREATELEETIYANGG
jgi:uncharacterized DUF497 family protein